MNKEPYEIKGKCPKCRAPMIGDGEHVWCTFVGGGGQVEYFAWRNGWSVYWGAVPAVIVGLILVELKNR